MTVIEPLETNRFIIKHPYFEGAVEQMRLCFESYGKNPEPRCTPILGLSGAGKSTVVREVLKTFGNPLENNKTPVIVVETPSTPTVRSLASEVLYSLKDPLYYKGTEATMITRAVEQMDELRVQMMIFEEMQNIIDRDSEKLLTRAAIWLKRFINRSKRPTVIMGLERLAKMFHYDEQLRRRFTKSYVIKPFDGMNNESRLYLRTFLKTLHKKFQFQDGLEIFSGEMPMRFYYASAGLVGYMTNIIFEAERLAERTVSHKITRDHIAQAYENVVCENQLVGLNPFIAGIKKCPAALAVIENIGKICK